MHSSNWSELLPDGFLCSLVLSLRRTDLVQLTLQFARDAWSRAGKILEFVPEIEVLVVRCRQAPNSSGLDSQITNQFP